MKSSEAELAQKLYVELLHSISWMLMHNQHPQTADFLKNPKALSRTDVDSSALLTLWDHKEHEQSFRLLSHHGVIERDHERDSHDCEGWRFCFSGVSLREYLGGLGRAPANFISEALPVFLMEAAFFKECDFVRVKHKMEPVWLPVAEGLFRCPSIFLGPLYALTDLGFVSRLDGHFMWEEKAKLAMEKAAEWATVSCFAPYRERARCAQIWNSIPMELKTRIFPEGAPEPRELAFMLEHFWNGESWRFHPIDHIAYEDEDYTGKYIDMAEVICELIDKGRLQN